MAQTQERAATVRKTIFMTAWVLCIVLAHGTRGDAAQQETNPLQGTWNLVRVAVNGTILDEAFFAAQGVTWTFKGHQIIAELRNINDEQKSNYEIDASCSPKRITITPVDPSKGKVLHAIYEIDGDTLRIAYRERGDDETTPTDFKEGQGFGVITLRKPKP